MSQRKVLVITNVYNEYFNLPIWRRYYGSQFGEGNLLIIDHGSDDGSTDDLGKCQIIRVPRSPLSDGERAAFVSDLTKHMLIHYDVVIYTDCDEFLVPDPRIHGSLADYCQNFNGDSVTAVGLNLLQHVNDEYELDLSRPILEQRRHCFSTLAMSKTSIVRKPVQWGGGFHTSSLPIRFDDVYNLHLKLVDLPHAIERLRLTQQVKMKFVDRNGRSAGSHQRIPVTEMMKIYLKYASQEFVPLDHAGFTGAIMESLDAENPAKVDLAKRKNIPKFHWKLPEEFQAVGL